MCINQSLPADSHFDRMTLLTLYRTSKIGDCLAEALDEMIMQEKIPGDLGMKVMAEVSLLKDYTQASVS